MENQFFSLKDAVENLIVQLQQYESDTFSASEEGVDRVMAERMAAWLIRVQLFDAEGMPGDGIDGAVVGNSKDAVMEAFSPDALEAEWDALVEKQEVEAASLWSE